MTKIKQLTVETPQGTAGKLSRESRYSFNYLEGIEVQREVSLIMPLRAESYADGRLFSVFEMNRPEGYLLDYLRQRFGKHESLDDMRLLQLTGSNQIGRLRYVVAGEQTQKKTSVAHQDIIHASASRELFAHLVDLHFNSGVSGFQPKVLVPDSRTCIDAKSTIALSDLIVKSAGDDYPFLAQNEFMCMEVARRAGLQVPEFWLSDDGGLFIMSRFDITSTAQFGLEDMAVLMRKSPEEKYQGSYENIAKAIELFCGENAQESKRRLFEYVALSCLVKNGDAHLKNFALLYDFPAGKVRLSPLYDVVSTSIYDITHPQTGATKTDNSLALKLRKSKRYPSQAELIEFGRASCQVTDAKRVLDRLREAQLAVLRDGRNRINPWLMERLQRQWA